MIVSVYNIHLPDNLLDAGIGSMIMFVVELVAAMHPVCTMHYR